MKIIKSKKIKLTLLTTLSFFAISNCTRKYTRDGSQADNQATDIVQSGSDKNLIIQFNGNSNYNSPVIYLKNGNIPVLARDINGVATTGGYDGNQTIPFTGILFTSNIKKIDTKKIKVSLYDGNQESFCSGVNFSIQNNNITFQNTENNKLYTMTSCNFKITSDYYKINHTKLNLQFNYTIKDWGSNLGASSQAQITAQKIESACKNVPNQGCLDPTYELELFLNENYIKDISPITSLINLVRLKLQDNAIQNVPSSISELKNLIYLDLRNNSISSLPESFSNLVNLKNLLIGFNSFQEFPVQITNLTNLQNIWFSNSKIVSIPNCISKLKNLELLDLRYNQITNVPNSVGDLVSLKKLWLNNNSITSVSDNLVHLKLDEIYLQHNQILNLSKPTFLWINSIITNDLSNNPGSPNFGN